MLTFDLGVWNMSDLANADALQNAAAPQLPVHWYFDQHIYDVEMEVLFKHGPQYVGHELMVPEMGDYHTLEWMDHAKMLVRNQNGIELLSNVCRHRQAIMLRGKGNTPNIVCPIHRWTYDQQGQLLGAPHFPQNPCLHLGKSPLQNWNGLLFQGERDVAKDLAKLGVKADLDFSGYMLDTVVIDELQCNWKTFIEVYLEDYHVVPYHPGLGNFVNCDELKWEFGDWYSVQTVGILNELKKSGSKAYGKWHDAVLSRYEGKMPEHGAIWLTYYPNITVEWYPHCLVVSTVIAMKCHRWANSALLSGVRVVMCAYCTTLVHGSTQELPWKSVSSSLSERKKIAQGLKIELSTTSASGVVIIRVARSGMP